VIGKDADENERQTRVHILTNASRDERGCIANRESEHLGPLR
jgi:hypothetical protein